MSTYNSYAASLVTDHALRLGIEPTSRLLGEAGQWQLANEVVESWAGDLDTEAATSTLVEAVLQLSGALAEHLRSPAEARAAIEDLAAAILEIPDAPRKKGPYADVATLVRSLGERARVLEVVEAYHRRKRLADAIDFGDQVAIAARLAREVEAVGRTERSRYRVVLLDEYQDTSHAQLELLSALFGGGHPVTAVGDPHQSIYGWRGASAGGLERFPDRFPAVVDGRAEPAPVRYLSTSWRNDHAILDAANLVARPLRAAGEASGRVVVPRLEAAPRAGAGTVLTAYPATVEEEAAAIARFVAERWRPAGPAGGRVTAAVLCRKRSQFDAIEIALRAAGLPVEVVGLGGLLSTPEVVDLVSVLRAAHDPSRGDALVRLLTGARVRLGIADLHALAQWAGELAGAQARDARRGARPASPAAAAAAFDDEATVVVEGDVVDERSIVDALDDLPPRGWRSHTGRTLGDVARERLADLARLLRTLRSHTYLSLPELVGEAERLLGLGIEVAARPGSSPGRARAHLDAFRDVAVGFSDGADAPTLGAFLAWLDAAAREERGLERPVTEPDPDAVQVITVHAAKGLEWDVVAVAGLTDGVLPATATSAPGGPAASGWLTGLGVLPYPLRGDADELPVLPVETAVDQKEMESLRKEFRRAVGAHDVAEERRLAYVALTRARSALLLTGSWWRDRKDPQPPSLFLGELVRAGLAGPEAWADEPGIGAANPRTAEPVTHAWPTDPFGDGPRRAHVTAAAAAVRAAMAAGAPRAASWGPPDDPAGPGHPADRTEPAEPAALAGRADPVDPAGPIDPADPPDPARPASLSRTLDLLLAERDRARDPLPDVALPPHLSASALVRLAADRDAFAESLRRPVPLEPSVQARRGTDFHAWVERYFAAASLVDVEALPGADDDSVAVDADAAGLRAAFLATPWAALRPRAVEVDIETPVAGYVLRCRVDAVFDEADGRVTVVDWKTGRPPADPAAARAREVQLAVYRLAWSRWSATPIERVGAAFCYVGAGVTVRPERLLDESEIEALLAEAAVA